jgi:hypothetical protein
MSLAKLGQHCCPNTYAKILPRIQGGFTAKSVLRAIFSMLPPRRRRIRGEERTFRPRACAHLLLLAACIALAGDEIDRLSLETVAPLLFCSADLAAPQARGHA